MSDSSGPASRIRCFVPDVEALAAADEEASAFVGVAVLVGIFDSD